MKIVGAQTIIDLRLSVKFDRKCVSQRESVKSNKDVS